MSLLEEIKRCNNLHRIPKEIHVNRGVLLDFRLVDALENPDPERDRVYDFDVYARMCGNFSSSVSLSCPYCLRNRLTVWLLYRT